MRNSKITKIAQITFWILFAIAGTFLFLNNISGGALIVLGVKFWNFLKIAYWAILLVISVWRIYKLTSTVKE